MVLLSVVDVFPCAPPFGGDFFAIFEIGMTKTSKTTAIKAMISL
jgi:hypothetical protein